MKIFHIFGIGARSVLAKSCSTKGRVTGVKNSSLHVIKKPVRLYVSENNTIFSHYITFDYTVDNIVYTGKLYVDLRYRCPQKDEIIDVYYDPKNPRHYACYSFGPGVSPIGW